MFQGNTSLMVEFKESVPIAANIEVVGSLLVISEIKT